MSFVSFKIGLDLAMKPLALNADNWPAGYVSTDIYHSSGKCPIGSAGQPSNAIITGHDLSSGNHLVPTRVCLSTVPVTCKSVPGSSSTSTKEAPEHPDAVVLLQDTLRAHGRWGFRPTPPDEYYHLSEHVAPVSTSTTRMCAD